MKLRACVALGYHLIIGSRSMSTKGRIVSVQVKEATGNQFENQYSL